jgi:hypothetical protein
MKHLEYAHPHFVRGEKDLLRWIERKATKTKTRDAHLSAINKDNENGENEVPAIRERQCHHQIVQNSLGLD